MSSPLQKKETMKVPEPTLRRLPWYLSNVKLLKQKGERFVSSTQISKEINIDASQIAKDLSYVNISGRTRVGYEVDTLIAVLEDFLGFTNIHKAFLFGVGSLGGALLRDSGLSHFGLEIVAAFDETDQIGVRMGDWKMVVKKGTPFLYNLATDIHEDHDIAAGHPDIVKQMKEIIRTQHTPNPHFSVTLPSFE